MLSTIRTFVLNELTLQKRVFFLNTHKNTGEIINIHCKFCWVKFVSFSVRLASHDFMWKKEDKVGNKTGYKKRKNGKGKKKRGRKKDQNNFGKKSKGCLICMCKPKSYLITSNYQQSLHFLPILMLLNWLKLFHKKKDQYKLNMFSLLLTGRCQRAKPSASYSPNFFLHNPGSDKEKFS